jgi:hypothetical protein
MPRYKVKDNVTTTEGATFIKGEVVEGTQRGKSQSMINVQRKNKFGTDNTLMLDFDIEKVDDSTPLTNPADFKGAIQEYKKSDKTLTIFSTIGGLAGLYYAYSKGKGFWGYVGFMVLGGIAGSLVANVVTKMKKPKLADATKKDTAITPTASSILPSSSTIKTASPTSADTSKMSKAQKIDLIIKNQRGSEPVDADDENNSKAFLKTLTDAELNIWISLSKALKDEEINKAMDKSQEEGFKLLQSKYSITRKDAEQQMKKSMDFLTKGMESAGFKVTEGKSMFSNFESSLDLDL